MKLSFNLWCRFLDWEDFRLWQLSPGLDGDQNMQACLFAQRAPL